MIILKVTASAYLPFERTRSSSMHYKLINKNPK